MKKAMFVNKVERYVNSHWKLLLFVLLGLQACGLIFCLVINGIGMTNNDAPDYITPALSFMHGGKMLDAEGNPILFRTPGYPFMLALIYGCTGGSNLAVVIIQMFMVLGITLMIFSVVSRFTNYAAGLLASFLYAMDFAIYGSASSILTDTPFSFFVALGAYLLVLYVQNKKMRNLLLCFASLNFAMLIRPNIMYLNMLLFAGLLILSLMKKLAWKQTIAFLLMFVVVFGGWSMRNAVNYGQPVYCTIRDDSTFLFYAPLLYSYEEQSTYEETQNYFNDALERKYPEYESMGVLEKTFARRDIGTEYIKGHMIGYIKMNIKGLFYEMFGPNLVQINKLPISDLGKKVFMLAVMGMLFVTYAIYAIGFIVNIKKLTWLDWLLLAGTLYFMASTAVLGYSRFRLAYYPICLMGAFLCWKDSRRVKERVGV